MYTWECECECVCECEREKEKDREREGETCSAPKVIHHLNETLQAWQKVRMPFIIASAAPPASGFMVLSFPLCTPQSAFKAICGHYLWRTASGKLLLIYLFIYLFVCLFGSDTRAVLNPSPTASVYR